MPYKQLREVLDASENIVFFGGAGVSTESHIPDFRSATGLYHTSEVGVNGQKGYSPEEILSRRFFMKHPEDFFKFYRENMIYESAMPNDAHKALAMLESEGKLKAVITQNIDGLHQKAGSKNVLELHGSIHKNTCMDCGRKYALDKLIHSQGIPRCDVCGAMIKPDVVLYEESLNMDVVDRAINFIMSADVLIVGGTSLAVYPAAGLIDYYRGKKLILINRGQTTRDDWALFHIEDSIGKVFKEAYNL